VTDGATGGSPSGLRGALAQLGSSLLGLLRTRLELAALDFDEERQRAAEGLVLTLVAVLFVGFAIFAAQTFIVAWFWDTHRFAAIGGVLVFDLAIGLAAFLRLQALRREQRAPFAATLAELERDRAWLAERFGQSGRP
jgi:uncharacterized membrane protein YqjE